MRVKIKSSGAQGVFLGGLVCENGGKLIKDLRNAVGPNVKIMMPDGFTPVSATIQQGGTATNGSTVSVAGLPNSALKGAGQVVRAGVHQGRQAGTGSRTRCTQHRRPRSWSRRSQQSNGTRADIAKQLFKINLKGSILGDVSFNANGDVTSNPVTIYKIKGSKYPPFKVIVPPKSLVKIA